MCVNVCECVLMCVCVCVNVCANMHVCMYVCVCVLTEVRVPVNQFRTWPLMTPATLPSLSLGTFNA